MEVIKVSASSRTSAVAGAIAGVIRDHQHAEVQIIGAAAVNQAIKAVILASQYLREEGVHIAFTPIFVDVMVDDHAKTGIKLVIEPRNVLPAEGTFDSDKQAPPQALTPDDA